MNTQRLLIVLTGINFCIMLYQLIGGGVASSTAKDWPPSVLKSPGGPGL